MKSAWRVTLVLVLALAVGQASTALGRSARHATRHVRSSYTVNADPFTLRTSPLARGQIELLTLSTMPQAVTEGEALVAVRGLGPGDRLKVLRNRRSVTRVFQPAGNGDWRGLVHGLHLGTNLLTAIVRGPAGTRKATLKVIDHPIWGPVLSGPHQQPFYCQTVAAGLGPARDANCSVTTRFQWFYRSKLGGGFHQLADPYAPYPSDVASTRTAAGHLAPFVVRVESATINRGIARIAVLDDPHARGRGGSFAASEWDHVLTYAFGESCGVGYHQGVNHATDVLGGAPTNGIGASNVFSTVYGLSDRLGAGDAVAISTQTTFGVYCNPLTSMETAMMIKERIVDRYGMVRRTVGVGGSGGALQQYYALNGAPGLLDGATPIASFPDIPSTAMTVVDCGLLERYFATGGSGWNYLQRAQVAGHIDNLVCQDWVSLFLPILDPHKGCDSSVPMSIRFDPVRNPRGVRCTLQDATVNVWGRDPRTGFAYRPYDNTGVQYGLDALRSGQITAAQFVDLNRRIGGYDINDTWQPSRVVMPAAVAHRAYQIGAVTGRGALGRAPVIDLATYLDLIPSADIHDDQRPFQIRARLDARGMDASQSIWRGIALPSDARPALDTWLSRLDHTAVPDTAAAVAAAKPASAADRCIVAAGASISASGVSLPLGLALSLIPGAPLPSIPLNFSLPERQSASAGVCNLLFHADTSPRQVAGGPLREDVIKCQLRPVAPGDYAGLLSASQLAEMHQIFPTGVCDFSRPAVGDVAHSVEWPSVGAGRLEPLRSLHWLVGRSLVRRGR